MFWGAMDPFVVATSICDSFKTLPEGCVALRATANETPIINVEYKINSVDDNIYIIMFCIIIVFMIIGAVFVIGLKNMFSRQASSDVNELVKDSVGDYMKLKDTEELKK